MLEAESSPVIANNIVIANGSYSYSVGPVTVIGGALQIADLLRGSATVANNTVVANSGAGIAWANTSPCLSNNLVAFNTFGLYINPLNTPPPTELKSNCIYGNALQGKGTDFMGITDPTGANGNIAINPKLINYKTGQFHLLPDSPCIDAGATDAVDPEWGDFEGGNRISGAAVDIGADEFDGTVWDDLSRIIHVRPNGNDLNDGLSWKSAKKTIVSGIAAAGRTFTEAGGEVWVASGTYPECIDIPAFVYLYGGFVGNENHRSQRDIIANPAIIDGSDSGPVVTIRHGGYLVSSLDGFTVQNGVRMEAVAGDYGGGILCRLSGPVIAHNTITQNSIGNSNTGSDLVLSGGGGIGLQFSYAVISENNITYNKVHDWSSGNGGGIYCNISMPVIERNVIEENEAKNGAGIYCNFCSPHIIGNTVAKNKLSKISYWADYGAITCIANFDAFISKNLITGNTATFGGGITFYNGFNSRIESNVISGNTAMSPGSLGWGGWYLLPCR